MDQDEVVEEFGGMPPTADGLEVREAILIVSKALPGLSKSEPIETETRATLGVRTFVTAPAVLSVKGGCTVNLGNYESGRCDVMLSYPCYREEIEDVYPLVKEFVDSKLTEEYRELKAAASK